MPYKPPANHFSPIHGIDNGEAHVLLKPCILVRFLPPKGRKFHTGYYTTWLHIYWPCRHKVNLAIYLSPSQACNELDSFNLHKSISHSIKKVSHTFQTSPQLFHCGQQFCKRIQNRERKHHRNLRHRRYRQPTLCSIL